MPPFTGQISTPNNSPLGHFRQFARRDDRFESIPVIGPRSSDDPFGIHRPGAGLTGSPPPTSPDASQAPPERQGGGQVPQHFLYFLPEPQGHGALRPTFPARRGSPPGLISPST